MSQVSSNTHPTSTASSHLAARVLAIPPARRGAVLQSVVSFNPSPTFEETFAVGPIRAAFAECWEETCGTAVPIEGLREVLEPPVPIKTVLQFNRLMLSRDAAEVEVSLGQLIQHLRERLAALTASMQLALFESSSQTKNKSQKPSATATGQSVLNLQQLVDCGCTFPTIYADPPWPYDNTASRAAAVNHYPTLSIDDICAEPIPSLVEDNAHLHLWTTNAFLRDAFDVMDAWGFQPKSCFVWVKDQIGMGNYWRVSHEFLLLGIRGNLPFRDRTLPSWIQAQRTVHSRKPGVVRALIEKASPAPYLELYGREALPNSAWTVYGNQIEQLLF